MSVVMVTGESFRARKSPPSGGLEERVGLCSARQLARRLPPRSWRQAHQMRTEVIELRVGAAVSLVNPLQFYELITRRYLAGLFTVLALLGAAGAQATSSTAPEDLVVGLTVIEHGKQVIALVPVTINGRARSRSRSTPAPRAR